MTDVRLRGNEGDGHAVAHAMPAQRRFEYGDVLVGGAEAAGALDAADDHRPRIGDQFPDIGVGLFRMIHAADPLGIARVRTQARHILECAAHARGDDEEIVVDFASALDDEPVVRRIDAIDPSGDESDAVFLEMRASGQNDVFPLAPADRQPRNRGNELEVVRLVDHRDLVLAGQRFPQFVGGGHAAESSAEYHHMGHLTSPIE